MSEIPGNVAVTVLIQRSGIVYELVFQFGATGPLTVTSFTALPG